MDLSVVIPVFNESEKIAIDLRNALLFFREYDINGEIIVVDDGSTDQTGNLVKREIEKHGKNIHLISHSPNKGKGYAVRQGILRSTGKIVMFIDSGNCVPYTDILPAIQMIEEGRTDIAHASRYMAGSRITVRRRLHRRLISWLFRRFTRFYLNLPAEVTDSQCGLNLYRGDIARELYSGCRSSGFLFDVEIILKARQKGYRFVEFPVCWTPDHDSRLKPFDLLFKIGRELRQIKKEIDVMNS
jgi:dolichyl-phosphate beta-glucosyltransferase